MRFYFFHVIPGIEECFYGLLRDNAYKSFSQ